MISPGNKSARLVRVWFDKVGKKATPCFRVGFNTNEGAIEATLYLTDKAAQRTIDTLKNTLAWNGSEDFDEAGDFRLSNFNAAREYELVVENEEYDGKVYPRVKWINLPGVNRDKLAVEVVKSELAKLGLKAMYYSTPGVPAPGGSDFAKNEDVPF